MSYDVYLNDCSTGEVLLLDNPHGMARGAYAEGGVRECHLNITYNYSRLLREHLHEQSVRWLYGKTAHETAEALRGAAESIEALPDQDLPPVDERERWDRKIKEEQARRSELVLAEPVAFKGVVYRRAPVEYWVPSPANVARSLRQLLALAEWRPDGVWDGD